MSLRTITIGITGVVLLAPMVVPAIMLFNVDHNSGHWNIGELLSLAVCRGLIFWLFGGLPLLVSLFLAIKLKHSSSSVILFISTMAYGVWYATVCSVCFDGYLGPVLLVFVGVLSLPVMLPLWSIALYLEGHARTEEIAWERQRNEPRDSDPATALRSVPGSLKRENEVE